MFFILILIPNQLASENGVFEAHKTVRDQRDGDQAQTVSDDEEEEDDDDARAVDKIIYIRRKKEPTTIKPTADEKGGVDDKGKGKEKEIDAKAQEIDAAFASRSQSLTQSLGEKAQEIRDALEKIDRKGIIGAVKFDEFHDIHPNIMVLEVTGDKGEYEIPAALNSSEYVK